MIKIRFLSLLPLLLLAACATEHPHTIHAKTQGTFKVGDPYKVEGTWYYPKEQYDLVETGIASWYGPGFDGGHTASGEIYHADELTAAHRTLQMPSLVRVTNLDNGHSVIVRVNDRGPYARGRIMDVSSKAAGLLGMKGTGTAKVQLQVLSAESMRIAQLAKTGASTRGFETAYNSANGFRAARDDATDTDRALGVEPLEVFEIAIEERILVVPFDLEREGTFLAWPDVIDLMADRLLGYAVDCLSQLEVVLRPAERGKPATQALRHLGFAAATTDDLGHRQRYVQQRAFEFVDEVGKVMLDDGFGMAGEQHLEASRA